MTAPTDATAGDDPTVSLVKAAPASHHGTPPGSSEAPTQVDLRKPGAPAATPTWPQPPAGQPHAAPPQHGAAAPGPWSPPSPHPADPPAPPRAGFPGLLIGAGLVIVVLLAVIAALIVSGGKSEDTVVAGDNGGQVSSGDGGGTGGDAGFGEGDGGEEVASTRAAMGVGYTFEIPGATGWSLTSPRSANGGLQALRTLTGPGGESILFVHTPNDRAKPDPSKVVSNDPFDASVASARLIVLDDFPTDECSGTLCDDYVLNDPSFGGLAILASDSGGASSTVAADIARSVTPN